MTYPQHWLLSFGGGLGDPLESWSCGIRMGIVSEEILASMDEEQYLTDTAVPALSAWFARPNSRIASVAALNWIKFNEIGPSGRYADSGVTHQRLGLNVAGGTSATNLHPLQVCLVLRWRTNAVTRGPASIGRIYSPRPNVVVGSTGDVASAERTTIGESARDLLNSLDVTLGVGGVFRPVIVSNVGAGHKRQIDSVIVDSALDIQRRRAMQQSREATTVPVSY